MVKPHDEPAKVHRADGEILVDGPDGMTTSMTPDAALKTARELEEKAVEAIVDRAGRTPDPEGEPPAS